MSTVETLLTAIGYRFNGGKTISSTSDPSQATCIQWLNEAALWITGICAEMDSNLGRTTGTITTLAPSITAATQASPCNITATAHGFSDNDVVVIKDVVGMTTLNDTEYTVTRIDADNFTIGVDSTGYSAWSSGGYVSKRIYDDIASTLYAPRQFGWIVQTNYRSEVTLKNEADLLDYDPVMADEPSEFYIDGSNNVCFLVYPDDAHTVKIPYWTLPTTLTATTDTVPFLGLVDNVFTEAVGIRANNRDEYDLAYEMKWQSFLLDRVRKVILMRKNMSSKVS